jgi:transcriptional repressor NrdR
MQRLKNLDKIAYIRFASVYRSFGDIEELLEEVKGMLKGRGGRGKKNE